MTQAEPEHNADAICFLETLWTARTELSRLRGPLHEELSAMVGAAYVDKNIGTWQAMQKVLDSGEHRPTHLRARKPE